MWHMIYGTPLQAMTSESELILGALKSSKIIEGEKSKELEQSVSQLNKVCAFMHMSINRCVDYTKATSGDCCVRYLRNPIYVFAQV